MWAYLIRRLWQMVPTLIGVVLLVFLLFKFFGADPAVILGGLNATQEQVAAIRTQLGLDRPWWVQLGIYLKEIVTFDWGRSWATNEAVSNLFATRLPATLTVMIPILILDTLLAKGDHYLHLADLKSYSGAHTRLGELYQDQEGWTRKAILNIAASGELERQHHILDCRQ